MSAPLRMTRYTMCQWHRAGGERHQFGSVHELTWAELASWVAAPKVTDLKNMVGAFSLATYGDGWRCTEHVESVCALGFDVDHTDVTPAVGFQLLEGWQRVIYTTASHTPTSPRWRLVFGLSRPVCGKEYRGVWRVVAGHLVANAIQHDPSCADPCRAWFSPSVRPGHEADHEVHAEIDGRPIDVEKLLVTARAMAKREAASRPAPRPVAHDDRYIAGAIRRATDAIARAPSGHRNTTLNREAFGLARLAIAETELTRAMVDAALAAGLTAHEARGVVRRAIAARARRSA